MVFDFLRCAGDLGELGAVRNQGIFDAELVGDPVTVGFDPVLQLDLRLREGEMVGIAAGTAREGLRVAGETFTQGGREGANEAVVAFTEVDALEDRGLGVTLVGGFGDLEYEDIAANFERRGVEALRLVFAPVPDGVEGAEAGTAETLTTADAPVDVGGRSEAGGTGLDLGATLLIQPVEAAVLFQVAFENVAQGGEMPDVEGGVVEKFRRDGALGPIGFLARLIDGDAEVFFEETGETDTLAAEELGGEHGIEDTCRPETTEIGQQAEIEITAVHHQVFFREDLEERLDVQTRGKDIDEENLTIDEQLEKADARFIVIHIVRLGIEEDLVDAIQGGEERGQRAGLVEELVGGRAGSHFDAEQTANRQWKEVGNHASDKKGGVVWRRAAWIGHGTLSHALRKASINKGRSSL